MTTAKVDLHLHSTCSDGRLTPTQLVELVGGRQLSVMALTDHDSTEGMVEALEASLKFPDLSIIPGVELSTDIPGNEIHMLGYLINYNDNKFQSTLHKFREGRIGRAQEMVSKLANLGLPVRWERVVELADGAVGRPHIAQAMVAMGYIKYPQEAFVKYLGREGLAYAEREKLTPADSIALITSVGGIPVLAHPREVKNVGQYIPELKEAGLVGIEVYCPGYSPKEVSQLETLANREGLIPCGGSDYHALDTPGEYLPGDVGPSLDITNKLYAIAKQINLK